MVVGAVNYLLQFAATIISLVDGIQLLDGVRSSYVTITKTRLLRRHPLALDQNNLFGNSLLFFCSTLRTIARQPGKTDRFPSA